jgi:hypothetical protein
MREKAASNKGGSEKIAPSPSNNSVTVRKGPENRDAALDLVKQLK